MAGKLYKLLSKTLQNEKMLMFIHGPADEEHWHARPAVVMWLTAFRMRGKPRISPDRHIHILRKDISQQNLHISRCTESFLLTDCHLLRNIDVRSITVLYVALSCVMTPYQVCILTFSGFLYFNMYLLVFWDLTQVSSWSICSGVQCCLIFITWTLF